MELYEVIRKYAGMLDGPEFTEHAESGTAILVKRDGSIFLAETDGGQWKELEAQNVREVRPGLESERVVAAAEAFVHSSRKAMVISGPPYASICLEAGRGISVVLDDMAQIIGGACAVCENDAKAIARALKKRDAVLVRGAGLITTGHNIYEAVCAAVVSEKSAEVVLKAPVIGGAKPLPAIDVLKMRSFYLKKYSKEERAVHDADEQ